MLHARMKDYVKKKVCVKKCGRGVRKWRIASIASISCAHV